MAPVARSQVAVWVRPLLPPKLSVAYADQVTILLLGSSAAATGTSGKLIVPLHRPALGGGVDAVPSRLISAALVHGPRLPASVRAVSRTYRAGTAAKAAVFSVASSAHVPPATGVPHPA